MTGATLDLETLPFPVAYPLSYARDGSLGASDRVDNVFFGGYQTVRTTALLLLADYLESSETCPRVSEAIRDLRLPHWKEWVELATTLAKFWKSHLDQRPERETRFPTLVTAWLETAAPGRPRTDGEWPTLLNGSLGGHGPARGPVDALWYARNHRTHGTGTRTGDPTRDAALLARLLPLLEALTAALFPPGAFTLLRRASTEDANGLRVIRLHGPHRDRRFEAEEIGEEWASAFETTGVAAITGGEAVVVHPLFLPPDPDLSGGPVEGGGFLEDLYLVDRVSERKVVALGVLDERRLPENLIADVTAALRRKQVELGLDRDATRRWNLVDWSASTAGRLLGDLTSRKYFPDFYYERPGVDATLRRTLELEPSPETSPASARGRALLVLGEAGSGKSSLLCRLVDGLLQEQTEEDAETVEKPKRRKRSARAGGSADLSRYLEGRTGGDVVLYLAGASAYGGDAGNGADALLCDAVVRQGGVLSGAFPTLEHFVTKLDESAVKSGRDADRNPDRKVWIVLDGINEADRFKDLVGALDRFLPHVAQRPWLRLVVSIRSGAYHELERKDRDAMVHEGAVFRNVSCWASFPGDRPDAFGRKQDVPYLEVRPFAAGREGAEAYRLRQAWQGGKSSKIRYEDLPPGVKTPLLSPLHLHLFHETWAGQGKVPVDLDELGLFDAFLTRLTKEHSGLEERLQLLAEVMLERREALLPIEVAEKWEEESGRRAGTMAARLAKLTPVEELVAASILMRPVEEGQGSQRRLIGYRFSHQSLASAVLARHLRARLQGQPLPTAGELLSWAREASGEETGEHAAFPELVDAVATYVVACTKAGDGEAVAMLLDLETQETRHRLFGLALYECERLRGDRIAPSDDELRFFDSFEREVGEDLRRRRLPSATDKAHYALIWSGAGPVAEKISRILKKMLLRLIQDEPTCQEWKNDLAGHLQRMAILLLASGRSAEADVCMRDALQLQREILNTDSSNIEAVRNLAVSLGHLGNVLALRGASTEALPFFEENVTRMQMVVAATPDRIDWLRDLSVAIAHLCHHLSLTGAFGRAQALSEDNLALMRRVTQADPGRQDWKVDLVLALNLAGDQMARNGRTDEATSLTVEGLRLGREVVAEAPSRLDWKRHLSFSLSSLSVLLESQGKFAEALRLIEEGVRLMREVVAAAPTRTDWQRDLAGNLSVQSEILFMAGTREHAESVASEGLQLMRKLVGLDPGRLGWRADMTVLLARLSEMHETAGRMKEAQSLAEECVSLGRELAAVESTDLRRKRNLTVSLSRLSDLHASAGRGREEESLSEESLAVMRELVAAEPGCLDWKHDLTVSLNRLSDLRASAGRAHEAESLAEEGLALRRELVDAEPGRLGWKCDLTTSLERLIELRARVGRGREAESFARECLALRRELVDAEPNRLDWKRDLTVSLYRASQSHGADGDTFRALELGREDLELSRQIVGASPLKPTDLSGLLASLRNVRDLLRASGDEAGADALLNEEIEACRALFRLKELSLDDLRLQIDAVSRAMDLTISEGDLEKGLELAVEAAQLRKQLASASGRRWETDDVLLSALATAGALATDLGQFGRAEELLSEAERAAAFLRKAYRGSDTDSRWEAVLNRIGKVALAKGDSGAARTVFENVLQRRKRRFFSESNKNLARYSLAVSETFVALATFRTGDREVALAHSIEATALLRRHLALVPDDAAVVLELAWALRVQDELLGGGTASGEEAQRILKSLAEAAPRDDKFWRVMKEAGLTPSAGEGGKPA